MSWQSARLLRWHRSVDTHQLPCLSTLLHLLFSNSTQVFLWESIPSPLLVLQSGAWVYSCDFCGWLRHGRVLIQVAVWEEMTGGDSGRDAPSSSGRVLGIPHSFPLHVNQPVGALWAVSDPQKEQHWDKAGEDRAEERPPSHRYLVIKASPEGFAGMRAPDVFPELQGAT